MSYILTHPLPENCDHSYSILSAKISANEPFPEYMERFNEIICDFMREQGVPGAALCLSLHGKVIYRQGYGISGPGRPTSSSSHFRIASISKVITAIAIMRLVENGLLQLDQLVLGHNGILSHIHVSKAHQDDIGSITVRHLLQHSGGWDREQDGDQVFWYTKQPHRHYLDVWNNWSLVMYVLACPLRFSPGTKHAYSNFGYLLLGLVIERVTKIRYEEYIHSVLREVGLEQVVVGKTKRDPIHYTEVQYFNNKDPQVEKSVFEGEGHVLPQYGSFPMENTGAFGGLVTCAENLVTLIDSLNVEYDLPRVVTVDSIVQMLKKPSYARHEDEAWYGLGLDVDDSGSSFGHTGAMEGTSTTVHHCKNGLTWCLLMNSWAKDMDLDGLIKFALASIPGLPLWQKSLPSIEQTDYQVMSADMVQCVRILLPLAEIVTHVDLMRREGYRIAHLSVLNVGSDVLSTLVWNKNTQKKMFGIYVDVDLGNFDEEMTYMRDQGAKILFLEAYWRGREVRHICVYEETSEPLRQRFYCVDDNKRHLKRVIEHREKRYELRAQSYLYDSKETFWVTALYDKISPEGSLEQRLWNVLPIDQFVEKLAESVEQGLQIDYLKFNSTPDMPKISAVWINCRRRQNVFQRHDVSKYGFLFELRETMQSNLRVLFLNAYESEGVVYFATIWDAKKPSGGSKKSYKRKKRPLSQPKQRRRQTVMSSSYGYRQEGHCLMPEATWGEHLSDEAPCLTGSATAGNITEQLRGEVDTTIVKQEIDTWQFDDNREAVTKLENNLEQSGANLGATVVKQEMDILQFGGNCEALAKLGNHSEQSGANLDATVVKQDVNILQCDGNGEALAKLGNNLVQSGSNIDATVVKRENEPINAWQCYGKVTDTVTTLIDSTNQACDNIGTIVMNHGRTHGQQCANIDDSFVKFETLQYKNDAKKIASHEHNTEQSYCYADAMVVKQEREEVKTECCNDNGEVLGPADTTEDLSGYRDTTAVMDEPDLMKNCKDEEWLSSEDCCVPVQLSGYTDVVYVKEEGQDELVWQVEISQEDMEVCLADNVEVVWDNTAFSTGLCDDSAMSSIVCDNTVPSNMVYEYTVPSTMMCDDTTVASVMCDETNNTTMYYFTDVSSVVEQQAEEIKEEVDTDMSSVVEQQVDGVKEEMDAADQPGPEISNETKTESEEEYGNKTEVATDLNVKQGIILKPFEVYSHDVGFEEGRGIVNQSSDKSENSTAKPDQSTAKLPLTTPTFHQSTNHNQACTDSSALLRHSSVNNSNSSSSVPRVSSPMKRKRRTIKPTWKVIGHGLKPEVVVENVEKDFSSKGMYKRILD